MNVNLGMKGWKTWVGVAGIVMTRFAGDYLGVDMSVVEDDAAILFNLVQSVFGALTVVGLGHKIEKLKDGGSDS